jgi:hypothetical protein
MIRKRRDAPIAGGRLYARRVRHEQTVPGSALTPGSSHETRAASLGWGDPPTSVRRAMHSDPTPRVPDPRAGPRRPAFRIRTCFAIVLGHDGRQGANELETRTSLPAVFPDDAGRLTSGARAKIIARWRASEW